VKLSICIPTHHGRCALLEEGLESIAGQVSPDLEFALEVVVSDNASQDGTDSMVAAFAKRYPAIAVVYGRNERDIGLANIARAIERASGDWCWLFGSDDTMVEGGLELAARTIAAYPGASGMAVGRVDFDFALAHRLAGVSPEVKPAGREVTLVRGFAAIEEQLAFQLGFLGTNVVRRDRWLAAAAEKADAAVAAHPNWPQLVILGEMARRDPTWIWQPTVLVRARAGQPYLVEGDGAQPNLARMHVLLVDGLHAVWKEVAAEDAVLYRGLMRRTYAVVGSAEVVHHIKMSHGYRAPWGLRLARSFISAFWWHRPFRRDAVLRLLTPGSIYRFRERRRVAAGPPMPILAPDDCRSSIAADLSDVLYAREVVLVGCRVTNDGATTLATRGEQPIQIGARWTDDRGAVTVSQHRAVLPHPLPTGQSATIGLYVDNPWEPGRYRLRIGLVQENVRWFGDSVERNDLIWDGEVRLPASPPDPLA
jgi:glycosyltransferase involved in cell wall biosynthesis